MMKQTCTVCGREQQEFHPDFPDLRDWFYGPPRTVKCGDCAIKAGEEHKSLREIEADRKAKEK